MRDPVYLDHNATTPLLPEVLDAMLPWLREGYGNPSSGHVYGRRAKDAVERARAEVAALLGARPDEVVFTSGGTEADNLALRGVAGRRLVISAVEHPAVSRPAAALAKQGWRVQVLPVDGEGVARVDALEGPADLVSVMLANNETGALQPVAALRDAAAVLHSDAAQAIGKVPVHVDDLGVDLLTVAGHKLYAPKGVGALYVRRGTALAPLLLGAGHEGGRRPGTENVASIVGLGVACAAAARDLPAEAARQRALRDRLHAALAAAVPGLGLNGPAEARLPNTLSLRFPGVSGRAVLDGAPEVAASTGSACHEGGEEVASAAIAAMGVPDALGTVRLSLGRGTDAAAVDLAAAALARSWKALVG